MRREYRIEGLAEPISHYTDAVGPAGCSSSRASSPSTAAGELVGGDDVAAQARQVFENMRAVLDAAGCRFADVVKVTVYLTDVTTGRTSTRCAGRSW